MAVAFGDLLKRTGSSGQRKGLEPFDGREVRLTDFKVELKGREKDKEGNPKEQRRVVTAAVNTEGLKPRRARIPVRYAQRIMEDMDLRADDAEPYVIDHVRVVVGEHGATLVPVTEPKPEGARRRGRPGRRQSQNGQAAPTGELVGAQA